MRFRPENSLWRRDESVSVQDLVHLLRGTGDNGSITTNADGSVHDFGMFQQQADQRIGGVVVVDVPVQLAEGAWMDQIPWFTGQQFQKSAQLRLGGGRLDIFDDVELDATVAKDFQRAVRLASTRVVVDGHLFH